MLAWVLQPVRLAVGALVTHDSPRRLAAGAALGMLLGLVPKGNLTAAALAAVLLCVRVNLGVGLATAFVFGWIGMLLDPLAHQLGWKILSHPGLQDFFARCYELPLVPWSGLHNTVVMGQLVLGLYALYPVYWLSFEAANRWGAVVAEAVRRYPLGRALLGVDIASRYELGE